MFDEVDSVYLEIEVVDLNSMFHTDLNIRATRWWNSGAAVARPNAEPNGTRSLWMCLWTNSDITYRRS